MAFLLYFIKIPVHGRLEIQKSMVCPSLHRLFERHWSSIHPQSLIGFHSNNTFWTRLNSFLFCWAVVCRARSLREGLLRREGRSPLGQTGALGETVDPWWLAACCVGLSRGAGVFRAHPLGPDSSVQAPLLSPGFPFTCWLGIWAFLACPPACHPILPSTISRP